MTLDNEEFTDLKFQPLPTNISHPHKKRNIEDAVNPQEKAVEKGSAPTAKTTLIPRRPNPQNGWEPLPPFLQAQMIKATMKQLTAVGTAYGEDAIKRDLAVLSPETLLQPDFSIWNLPSVKMYVKHHLAARLEQELYRSAQRNPGYTGELHIHLFCPPDDVMEILMKRIPGDIVNIEECPDSVRDAKKCSHHFNGEPTSRARLVNYLNNWDRQPVAARNVQELLNISDAVWKDLLADKDIRKKMDDLGIERTRSGRNTIWQSKAA